MDVVFLMGIFRLCPGSKKSFEHSSVRKNLFLSARFCWGSRLPLRELDQNFKFGGTIGYGDSYLDSVFRYSKVFRLLAILHDAAGAIRFETGKRPGYCYMIGRSPNCCLLGQVTFILSLRKNLSTLHFHFNRLLNQYVFDCARYRAN